jgi:hypothetical protein
MTESFHSSLLDDEGQISEQGRATLVYDGCWEYRTSSPAEANIVVEAFDLAGNVTEHKA